MLLNRDEWPTFTHFYLSFDKDFSLHEDTQDLRPGDVGPQILTIFVHPINLFFPSCHPHSYPFIHILAQESIQSSKLRFVFHQ